MEYEFEKLTNEEMYQVRLNGEFVTYTYDPRSEVVDRILTERGYQSRREYFDECVRLNMAAI